MLDGLDDLLNDPRLTEAGLLIEAEAALVRRLDADLRAHGGMPLATFEVLVRLARSPDRRLRLSELSRQLSLTTGGVTRLVDRLEAQQLLRRTPDPSDRRGAYAQIADAGLRALQGALPVHLAALQRDLVEPLQGASYRAMSIAARALRDHLSGDPAARLQDAPR